MKINVEFTVIVTNEGDINKTKVTVSNDSKFIDVRTAIDLAKKNLDELLIDYISKECKELERPLSEKEADRIIQKVTFKQIYEK
jgi:hypothetical protein